MIARARTGLQNTDVRSQTSARRRGSDQWLFETGANGSLGREARLIPRGGTCKCNRSATFLALCEERSFTRAAKRCGVSQPSLTNAIIRLEQELGGALFQRKPLVSLTGHGVHPYFNRIAQNADREAAQAMADVRRSSLCHCRRLV